MLPMKCSEKYEGDIEELTFVTIQLYQVEIIPRTDSLT
ncbi:hypothetical protein F652_2807 [Enterobacteriaceae bacterium bta3-1]|nr:hypothetical protein F652_2807 [Enterobacteriaceae bacterium bta3-1]